MQLDRFLQRNSRYSQKQVRQWIVSGRVCVDGKVSKDVQCRISRFSHVQVDGTVLQEKTPYYLMLHKPRAVVSATCHAHHRTVIDCVGQEYAGQLHLAGRLDFNSTGLMLLTNDGRWSRTITQPREKVAKTYLVETEAEITQEYVQCFAKPMYLAYENVHLQPAELVILGARTARITIYEGRYHQIKRMFGFFNNKVVGLHRESMGHIRLDPTLLPGDYRSLSREEILSVSTSTFT